MIFFQKKINSLDEFGDIASILGLVIYLEMIELNFCGLNYNLKKNIIIRGKEEYKNSLTIKYQIREGNFSSFDIDNITQL